MAFLANQLHEVVVVAAVDDAAAGNPVLPGVPIGVNETTLPSEERDWASLAQDAVREIANKLLADDVTEYMRLRSVCAPWRSSTAGRPAWEPCFFPRNWAMLRDDEDFDDEFPADPAEPRCRRFANVRTGAMLSIQLPSFEEHGYFLANTEGLLLFFCERNETVRLLNPVTTATAVLPSFLAAPGMEDGPELTAAGIVVDDRRNALEGEGQTPTVVPNVVLVLVSPPPRHRTVILCAKPGADHWGTIDAGVVQVEHGEPSMPFQAGLSVQGRFYIPTRHGDVLRVELYPQPHLVYVARPPDLWRCGPRDVTCYLVPSLGDDADDGDENQGGTMLLVRVFADDHVDVQRVHLGNGSYTHVPQLSNRTIFLPGITLLTDRFPSLVQGEEEGYVHRNEHIEDYIGNAEV